MIRIERHREFLKATLDVWNAYLESEYAVDKANIRLLTAQGRLEEAVARRKAADKAYREAVAAHKSAPIAPSEIVSA